MFTCRMSSNKEPSLIVVSSLSSVGDDVRLARVNLFAQMAFDGRLELAILGGVDERVDAAVGEHQHHGEVVEPAREVDTV